MNLINELLGIDLEEAKKPKCTCEKDEATCKVHGKKLDESAEEYDDSAEFTDAWTGAEADFDKVFKVINDPRFLNWMKITDDNYGTRCAAAFHGIKTALDSAKDSFDALADEIEQADNG